jgi:hypothetical protein
MSESLLASLSEQSGKLSVKNGDIAIPKNSRRVSMARGEVNTIRAYANGTHDTCNGIKQTKYKGQPIQTALATAETDLGKVLQEEGVVLTDIGWTRFTQGIPLGSDRLSGVKHGYDVWLSEQQKLDRAELLKQLDDYVDTTGQSHAQALVSNASSKGRVVKLRNNIVFDDGELFVDVNAKARVRAKDSVDQLNSFAQGFLDESAAAQGLEEVA